MERWRCAASTVSMRGEGADVNDEGHEFQIRSYQDLIEEYGRERGTNAPDPIRLGFGSLDADMRGISPGQVCGIAARTAVGKTWLLGTVEHNIAAANDRGTLTCSLEMPGLEWAERALAIHADVAPEQVERWAKHEELTEQAASFFQRMRHALLVEQHVQIGQLQPLIRQARSRLPVPLRVVFIDYMGLIGSPGRDTYEKISTIARGLKQIAKAEKVAVIMALQISRAGGDGSVPVSLDMLRDSGAIEESCDFIVGAWRPGRAANLGAEEAVLLEDVMRVKLLKNRKGHDGREIDLHFLKQSRKLVEMADPFAML